MKLTKTIYLTFTATQSIASAYISIPFKVKTIHCKALSITSGNLAVSGKYVTITSDLVNNAPLGSTFNSSAYSAGTIQDIQNQFWNPQVVQGYYNFTMYQSSGALYQASTGNDTVALIIEFNSPDEIL